MKVCLDGKIKFNIEIEKARRGRVTLRVDGKRFVLREKQTAEAEGSIFFDNGSPGDCK